MKKVIKDEELYKYLEDSIKLIGDTVKTTLGPSGSNVIINEDNLSPYITNDGVTIANAVESENKIINTILTIIKEAALKTNNKVGDGTTTTICLLESIFLNGLEFIKKGYNPIKLKNELLESSNKIISLLDSLTIPINDKYLELLASISSNDEKIGKLITDFYISLNKCKNIKIMENINDYQDYTEVMPGYFIDTSLASPYFLKNKSFLTINNPNLLIFDSPILDMNLLNDYINDSLNKEQCLIVIADSYADNVINEVLALNYEKENVILLNNYEYGIKKFSIIDDLKALINANNYGSIKKIIIDNNVTTFIQNNSTSIKNRIAKVKEDLTKEKKEYELEILKDRLSKLENHFGIIYVGGNTSIERRERKMRFDDALNALYSADDGILLGAGIPFLKISDVLKIENVADEIMVKSISSPFKQILINNGENYQSILDVIKNNDYNLIYNVKKKTFENKDNSSVIDSKNVLKEAIINATSIASLLLTTTHLIVNEQIKTINNSINDFNEI